MPRTYVGPCTTEGCPRRAHSRGLCRPCFDRARIRGTLPESKSKSKHGVPFYPSPGVGPERTAEIAAAYREGRLKIVRPPDKETP